MTTLELADEEAVVALLAGSGMLNHPMGPRAGGRAFQQAIRAYIEEQIVGQDNT